MDLFRKFISKMNRIAFTTFMIPFDSKQKGKQYIKNHIRGTFVAMQLRHLYRGAVTPLAPG